VQAAAVLGTVAGIAHAENFPSRPISIKVAYAARGGADVATRQLAAPLQPLRTKRDARAGRGDAAPADNAIVNGAAYQKWSRDTGNQPMVPMTLASASDFYQTERQRNARVITSIKLKPQ
jgi:hypothetical protein